MKVTAFNGSPRPNGNTRIMLDKVLEPIATAGIETETVQVGGKNIHGCISCWKCLENKNCQCVIDNPAARIGLCQKDAPMTIPPHFPVKTPVINDAVRQGWKP